MQGNEKMYEQEYEINDEVEPKEKRTINCPRSVFVTIIFLALVISMPILMFYFIIDYPKTYLRDYNYTCLVGDNYKVLCGKPNATYLDCLTNSCCYNVTAKSCYHYLPSQYFYKSHQSTFITSQNLTPYLNESIPEINFAVNFVDKDKLQINLNSQSVPPPDDYNEEKTYFTKTFEGRLGIEVYRIETNDLLMSTLKGPLIASNGYWEWTLYLKSDQLFGFGEIILEKNKTISKVIYKNKDDHNTLPIFMAYLNGLFHGVSIESDGPLEVTLLPSQLIKLKSLSGNRITINVCTGPTPRDVRQQQQSYKPTKLPYWSLGVHVCRDGITSMETAIKEYKDFVINNKGKIKFSSDCIHEALYSLLEERSHELEEELITLHDESHFVLSVSPQIFKKHLHLYETALNLNISYTAKDGKPYQGRYLKEDVIYPDFEHTNINTWFAELKKYMPENKIDGFVLKDNWPTDDSYTFRNEEYQFPYFTQDINTSMSNTIPWYAIAASENAEHIEKHNQYGASQVKAYAKNFEQAEFIITSSYDYGISQVAQIQNVDISWTNLKKAISTTLYHSMFGNPFITIPVCGSTDKFNKKLDELLCIRWYLTAATFPIFRISSELPRRDPSSLPSMFAQRITSNAIKQRFKLLPYYHTILSNSEPLVRPLFYDYYFDNETLTLDEQYMIGDALLVAQPLKEPSYRLRLYLPPSVGTWYEFWGGQISNSTGWVEISIIETDWIMYIAAGHIVPYRNIKSTEVGSHSHEDTFGVAIALKRDDNDAYNATGILTFNEATLNFQADENQLIISTSNYVELQKEIDCTNLQSAWPKYLEMATIYGINKDSLTRSTFSSFNLCDLQANEYIIPYFKPSQ